MSVNRNNPLSPKEIAFVFFVARHGAPEMFDLVEEALDDVANLASLVSVAPRFSA